MTWDEVVAALEAEGFTSANKAVFQRYNRFGPDWMPAAITLSYVDQDPGPGNLLMGVKFNFLAYYRVHNGTDDPLPGEKWKIWGGINDLDRANFERFQEWFDGRYDAPGL